MSVVPVHPILWRCCAHFERTCFFKKSKSGKGTPQPDLGRVTAWYHAAVQDYATNKATYLAATTGATREKKRAVPTTHDGEPEAIMFSPMHDNFFEAMGFPDAAERLAKAEMALAIGHVVKAKEWNQKHTAEVLGVAASDVSDLLRGKLARFSQERLERFLNALDMDVVIQIGPRPAWKSHASITVEQVAQFSRES
jgi:predicted XRE-type DNA-binding protein